MNNQKKMKRLELFCIALSASLIVLYNLMPLIVTIRVKNDGITDNSSFYANDSVMKAWMAYLVINLVIQTIVCTLLCLLTVQTVVTLKRFFRDQLFAQTRALILVTISILIASILSLFNDLVVTIVQAESQSDINEKNDTSDGLAISCMILWIPSFTINFLHMKNSRMQKKA